MNSKIYRCGWCGMITDKDGEPLNGDAFEKAKRIIEAYGDGHSDAIHGQCCPNGDKSERQRVQVTRDMAIDAGDPSLEGRWIDW